MKHALLIAILVVMSVAVFSNILQNPFIWDDKALISGNSYILNPAAIPFLFSLQYWNYCHPGTKGNYRPIFMASLCVDRYLWDEDVFGYHLTNITLHAANVIFIYVLALILTGPNSTRLPLLSAPFLSAAIFAVHPVHVESIAWIKNRGDPIALLFYLLSVILFIIAISARGPNKKTLSLFVSLISFITALLSKEMAITLPFILIMYVVCLVPPDRRVKAWPMALPFIGIAALYGFLKINLLVTDALLRGIQKIGLYSNALSVFKTIGYYTALLIFPLRLNAEHFFTVPRSFTDSWILFSAACVVSILAITIWVLRRDRTAGFALLWVIVTILPAVNIFYLFSRPIAEQRLYIPSVGFSIAAGIGLRHIVLYARKGFRRNRLFYSTVACIILLISAYFYISIMRNTDWGDPVSLWEKTVKYSPNRARAHFNLGWAYLEKGRTDEAIASFNRVLGISPTNLPAHKGLGAVYCVMKDYNRSIEHYKIALKIDPKYVDGYNNLGLAYQSAGNAEGAISAFKKSVEIQPDNPIAYHNMGIVYEELSGDHGKAVELYKKAIALKLDNQEVYFNLGIAYNSMGMLKEAVDSYKKAIQLNPDFAQAYNNLAVTFYRQNNLPLAREYALKTKRLGVINTPLLEALGQE